MYICLPVNPSACLPVCLHVYLCLCVYSGHGISIRPPSFGTLTETDTVHICMYVCMYVCMCELGYVCVYVVCVCVCVCHLFVGMCVLCVLCVSCMCAYWFLLVGVCVCVCVAVCVCVYVCVCCV